MQLVVQAEMLLHLKVEAVVVESSIRDRNIQDLDSSLLLIVQAPKRALFMRFVSQDIGCEIVQWSICS